MTEAKFQKNVPRSSTHSRISIFSSDEVIENSSNQQTFDEKSPTDSDNINNLDVSYDSMFDSHQKLKTNKYEMKDKNQNRIDSFSVRTKSRLDHINCQYYHKLTISDQESDKYKVVSKKLDKLISDLRILYTEPEFSWSKKQTTSIPHEKGDLIYPYNFQISMSQPFSLDLPFSQSISCFQENAILMNQKHYIKQITLDVDQIRTQDICESDIDIYLSLCSPDSHFKDVMIAGTFQQKLMIYNLNKTSNISNYNLQQEYTLDSAATFLLQNQQTVYVGCRDGQVMLHDFRTKYNVGCFNARQELQKKSVDDLSQSQGLMDILNMKITEQNISYGGEGQKGGKQEFNLIDEIKEKKIFQKLTPLNFSDKQKLMNHHNDLSQSLPTSMFYEKQSNISNPILSMDCKGSNLLISCDLGFAVFDLRNQKSICTMKSQRHLKSVFAPDSNQNIIGFNQDSDSLNCWNINTQKIFQKQILQNHIKDINVSKDTNEISVLQQREVLIDSDLNAVSSESIVDIYSNEKSRLKLVDRLTTQGPLRNIIFDREGTLLYGIEKDSVKIWQYFDIEQVEVVQKSLSPLLDD